MLKLFTLQRKEKGEWRDYLVDGEPVVNSFDVEALLPGQYRRCEDKCNR